MTADYDSLKSRYEEYGQGHVFDYWVQLDADEKIQLLDQLDSIDLEEVKELVEQHVLSDHTLEIDFGAMEPSPYLKHFERDRSLTDQWKEARSVGEQALRDGKVAAFTVAGGQGTRLGYDGPKGTFPVSPVTNATLFEVFASKIAFASNSYGKPMHWFIMTSKVNHEATEAFFRENNYFDLDESQVHLFSQGFMPAVDFSGKLIMESPSKLALTPDGHGGSLRALNRSGSVEFMRENGIEMISYFQVDNPLVKCLDPYFIGFHIQGNADVSSKMIPKAYPLEKVGHFCQYDGKMVVVEYSDLPNEYQEERLPDGELRFVAGSIAIHIFSTDFISKLGAEDSGMALPFHKAVKKIPTITADGKTAKPAEPNGVKFEMFVFDALPFATDPVLIETLREEDFSPVKNAEGIDSPESCKKHQLRMFARWLNAAGVSIEVDNEGVPKIVFEVSPSFASDLDSFVKKWGSIQEKPEIVDGLVLK